MFALCIAGMIETALQLFPERSAPLMNPGNSVDRHHHIVYKLPQRYLIPKICLWQAHFLINF